DAVDGDARLDLGPGEGLHQVLRQGQARSLDDDVLGRLAPLQQPLDGGQEILGDGAADAAIGELDHVVRRACGVAAAQEDLAVDAELAELVDDEGDAAAAGVGEQVAHEAGLAGAEKAGDDGGGDAAHDYSCRGVDRPTSPRPSPPPGAEREGPAQREGEVGASMISRASFSTSGRPAATSTTRCACAATLWLRRPAWSRKARASALSGTMPRPTSLATSTAGPSRRGSVSMSSAMA